MFSIFKKREIVFVHCPKTGGTYVCQHESGKAPVISGLRDLGHSYIVDDSISKNPIYQYGPNKTGEDSVVNRSDIEGLPVFSIVRNHYDWLVSYFYHAGGDPNNKYFNPEHYDYKYSKKGFDYLVRVICDREDKWPNNKLLFPQVFSSGGDMICDYIANTNSLDDNLSEISDIYGLKYQKKGKQRVGRVGDSEYKKYFSDSLAQLVLDTWEDELQIYGFGFDKLETNEPILSRHIDKDLKEQVKLTDNKLIWTSK